MLLPPAGNYRIAGRQSGRLLARRALSWNVACVEKPQAPIARSERLMGGEAWSAFGFEFTAPDKGCEGQRLTLALDAASISERIVSGEIVFTDLALRRVGL